MGPGTKERQHPFQLALGKLHTTSCACNSSVVANSCTGTEGIRASLSFALCTLRRPDPQLMSVSKLPSVSMLRFTPAEDLTQNYAIKIMQMVSYITSSAGIFHCLTLTLSKKEKKKKEKTIIRFSHLSRNMLTALSSHCCQAWSTHIHIGTLPYTPALLPSYMPVPPIECSLV